MKSQITYEKSPAYFRGIFTPQWIHSFNPSIKLLLVVKNPIQRSLSDYLHFFKHKQKHFTELITDKDGQITKATRIIDFSLYAKYLAHWLKVFKRDQIHIVDGDNFIEHPATELRKIEDFLTIKHYLTPEKFYYNKTKGFHCFKAGQMGRASCLKSGHVRRDMSMQDLVLQYNTELQNITAAEEIVFKLKQFFKPHNLNFYKMTGKTYNWD